MTVDADFFEQGLSKYVYKSAVSCRMFPVPVLCLDIYAVVEVFSLYRLHVVNLPAFMYRPYSPRWMG